MVRLETRVVIHRPVAEVFEFTTRFENIPQWVPAVRECRQTTSGPMGVGTTGQEVIPTALWRFTQDWQIIEYEPNRKCVFQTHNRLATTTVEFHFQSAGEGTELRCIDEGRLRGWLRLAEPLVARLVQKNRRRYLSNLKRALETAT